MLLACLKYLSTFLRNEKKLRKFLGQFAEIELLEVINNSQEINRMHYIPRKNKIICGVINVIIINFQT